MKEEEETGFVERGHKTSQKKVRRSYFEREREKKVEPNVDPCPCPHSPTPVPPMHVPSMFDWAVFFVCWTELKFLS